MCSSTGSEECDIGEDMTISVDKPLICPLLVGRDQELAALGHLLKRTSSGQGQMLLRDAVQQRARRLPQQARQLLTLAAVAGRPFDVRVLQHLLHCTDAQLLSLLKDVVAAQLVMEESADQSSAFKERTGRRRGNMESWPGKRR